jgi:hypothetical protein
MKNLQLMDYMVSLHFIDFISWGSLGNEPLYCITLWHKPPQRVCLLKKVVWKIYFYWVDNQWIADNKKISVIFLRRFHTNVLFICLSSARQQSVFAYPKQRATVLVGSVLKWRARPQCLHRQKSVFAYPKQRATLLVGSRLYSKVWPLLSIFDSCLHWYLTYNRSRQRA